MLKNHVDTSQHNKTHSFFISIKTIHEMTIKIAEWKNYWDHTPCQSFSPLLQQFHERCILMREIAVSLSKGERLSLPHLVNIFDIHSVKLPTKSYGIRKGKVNKSRLLLSGLCGYAMVYYSPLYVLYCVINFYVRACFCIEKAYCNHMLDIWWFNIAWDDFWLIILKDLFMPVVC